MASYGYDALDNSVAAYIYTSFSAMVPSVASHFSVDSFFMIRFETPLNLSVNINISSFIFSAILFSLSFFESLKKKPMTVYSSYALKAIYNRYIRLTPVYAIVMIFTGAVSTFLNDTSSLYTSENSEVNCRLYWWRNLLYIQNMWPMSEMCMTWSWYLAADFQLSIMACLLHMVYLRLVV